MATTVREILRSCGLFSALKPENLDFLAQIARLKTFRKGQPIFRQGQACPGAFVVGTGQVRIFRTAANGKEHVLHLIGPGQTFAEVAAIGDFACPAHAEAVAATTCVLLPGEALRASLQASHSLCLDLMAGMAFWVRHLVNLMEDVILRDAKSRLARYLLELKPADDGSIRLPGLKRHLASHLNLTSETFSRTLSKLIEAGLVVELGGNRLKIVDRKRLSG